MNLKSNQINSIYRLNNITIIVFYYFNIKNNVKKWISKNNCFFIKVVKLEPTNVKFISTTAKSVKSRLCVKRRSVLVLDQKLLKSQMEDLLFLISGRAGNLSRLIEIPYSIDII